MPKNCNTQQNWFQTAFNQVPKGQTNTKIDDILNTCSISLDTFYRWKRTGDVPNGLIKTAILNILK